MLLAFRGWSDISALILHRNHKDGLFLLVYFEDGDVMIDQELLVAAPRVSALQTILMGCGKDFQCADRFPYPVRLALGIFRGQLIYHLYPEMLWGTA